MAAVVGITGGIGSGKSVVSRILRLNGYLVYDCDAEAKRLMHRNEKLRNDIICSLGVDVYHSDGSVNKSVLSNLIFDNSTAMCTVNGYVHKLVRDDFGNFVKIHSDEKLLFCESAILATAQMTGMCDSIWLVHASDKIKMERVCRRNGISEHECLVRMNSQINEFDSLPMEKISMINNNGHDSVVLRILELIKQINRYA